ncbi:MAG: helix-turn-helix transcriptional regulator [Ruminococcaceae bacterium]|nr:helix-turn-helix transcriptional regulator [Oscillospiraceae bacterium]
MIAVNYISIGKRIKELRVAKGWTQAKLAEESGIEPSNISHIERAATKLSLPTLINIANALGVTIDEIVFDSLAKSSHISVKMIDEIISDCSPEELKALAQIIRTTKNILRNN